MNKINFTDLPSQTTPVNGRNMNLVQTNVENAINAIDTISLPITDVEEYDDLNDYITPGTYKSTSASITDTLTNCPYTGAGFKMIVEKVHGTQRYRQTLYTNTLTSKTFIRTYTGSWGEWQQAIFSPLSERNMGTLTSSVGHFEGDNYKWCRRSGNVVSFYLSLIIDTAITPASAGWTTAIANFPEGFRPQSYTLMTMAVGNQSSTTNDYRNVTLAVAPNGNLTGQWALAVGDKIQLGGTFII